MLVLVWGEGLWDGRRLCPMGAWRSQRVPPSQPSSEIPHGILLSQSVLSWSGEREALRSCPEREDVNTAAEGLACGRAAC